MKTLNRYFVITALAAPLLLSACVDNDVYDPDKVRPVPPVNNPLGDDFVAPDGFDWSMLSTVKLNIQVKDELNGQYDYLAEVFTTNPLLDNAATPIAAGYAKSGSNYVTEISIPKSHQQIFIRQTDPKQRKSVHQFDVPTDGGTLNCKLYQTTINTRALGVTGSMGWDKFTAEEYNEEQETDISGLTENPLFEDYSTTQLKEGSVFVIKQGETYNDLLTVRNQSIKATVIVRGVWNLTSSTAPQGLAIYLTDGGKLTGTPLLGENCILEIQKNSSVDCETFTNRGSAPIKNFGMFRVSGQTTFNTYTSIYNAKGATVAIANFDLGRSLTEIKNFGTFSAQSFINNNSGVVYNAEGAVMNVNQDIDLTSTKILNHGKLDVGETIKTNNNQAAIIANYATGTITANLISGGGLFINDNLVEVDTYDCGSYNPSELYNNCTFIVKTSLTIGNLVMDSGSLTGGRISDKEWKSIPSVSLSNNTRQELHNGSIIKATDFYSGNPCTIVGSQTAEASMLQVTRFVYRGHVYMQQNLILDRESEYYNNAPVPENNPWMVHKDASVITTSFGEAPDAISNCSGIIYPGNPGKPDPGTPEKPTIEDNTVYTYAFEDQWPAYGDFDMNDIIVTIDKMTATDENRKLTIQGRVRAVGASRQIGIGIQFLNVSSNGVVLSGSVQNGTPVFESNQNNPVIILSTNAHKYCNPGIADDDFSFYSTTPTASSQYNGDGARFEIVMTFPTAEEAAKAMNAKNLDVFIISKEAQGNVRRTEIHLPNYAPTNLGATALFGMGNDASAANNMLNVARKGYYISTEGLAWGICVPNTEVWKWPKEYMMITSVYPEFKDWVVNGGKAEDLGWISNHTNDVYVKP